MNFVVSDRRTTSHLADLSAAHVASMAAATHAVLIPSYNTGARLCDTVAIVRRLDWPVWVVVDGSTDGSGEALARQATNDPDLHVCVLPHNQGKGAAILHGLECALAQGITHVVTVDADGQHSADHIESLVALSRAHPEAMVLGVPVFDASAPAIRVAGHRISRFLANLATLRSGIGNPLFGFRVYPVAPLLRIFAETRWMRRFDFDSEAVIRLSWQGVPAINLPTPVRYFHREDGGVSHFHYLRDNLLLLFMYARLAAALVPRLPRLVARRFRSSHAKHADNDYRLVRTDRSHRHSRA
ncbi:MAG: glycosyltransferase family 2 protein [Acetobacteraceae bacterium]|jgi:glycosyltransferase involved in cell wall biosynthesis